MNCLERFSKHLQLIPYSQDWGICNADANRLETFLDFYDSHIPEDPFEVEDLAKLIFQSVEDALNADDLEPGLRSRLVAFFRGHQQDFPNNLEFRPNSRLKIGSFLN
jgi:hypothetical protein